MLEEVVHLHLILQICIFACVKVWLQSHTSAKNILVFICRHTFFTDNSNIKLLQTFAANISEGYAEKRDPGLCKFSHSAFIGVKFCTIFPEEMLWKGKRNDYETVLL